MNDLIIVLIKYDVNRDYVSLTNLKGTYTTVSPTVTANSIKLLETLFNLQLKENPLPELICLTNCPTEQ